MALDVDVARRLFTDEEYRRMGEAGILGEEERPTAAARERCGGSPSRLPI